jgi:hypothetical protein
MKTEVSKMQEILRNRDEHICIVTDELEACRRELIACRQRELSGENRERFSKKERQLKDKLASSIERETEANSRIRDILKDLETVLAQKHQLEHKLEELNAELEKRDRSESELELRLQDSLNLVNDALAEKENAFVAENQTKR